MPSHIRKSSICSVRIGRLYHNLDGIMYQRSISSKQERRFIYEEVILCLKRSASKNSKKPTLLIT